MQLFIELFKVRPPLVEHQRFWNQANTESRSLDADAIFDIFAEAGELKSTDLLPHLSRHAHIKAAWMELPYMLTVAPDAPSGKWGGHRIANRLLYGCKRFVG